MFHRARLRLTLWYGAAFFAVLAILGAAMYAGLTRSIDQQVDRGLAAAVEQWVASAPDPRTLPPVPLSHRDDHLTTDLFILVYRPDGALVANPRQVADEEIVEHAIGNPHNAVPGWRTVTFDHSRFRIDSVPLRIQGVPAGMVVAGRSLAERDQQVRNVVATLGGVAAAGLLLAAGGGYLLAGRAMQPLVAAYEGQRRFVGDASHELRSPITVIRTSADLLLRRARLDPGDQEAVEEIRDVADEAARLVDDLLELARMERQADLAPIPAGGTDLATVVADELDHLAPLCATHDTVVTRALAPVHAQVTEDETRRIVRALVENVLQHTPAGTACTVSASQFGGHAVLAVEDAGPGVDAPAREAIFERFTRVEAAHTPGTGSGLGLAIVRGIAARRGAAAAASAASAGGLRVEVRFLLA